MNNDRYYRIEVVRDGEPRHFSVLPPRDHGMLLGYVDDILKRMDISREAIRITIHTSEKSAENGSA